MGSLLVINGVITPISRVISPHLPHYFRALRRVIYSIYRDRLGTHLVEISVKKHVSAVWSIGPTSFGTKRSHEGKESGWINNYLQPQPSEINFTGIYYTIFPCIQGKPSKLIYSHRIHETDIVTYIWLMFMANVGNDT